MEGNDRITIPDAPLGNGNSRDGKARQESLEFEREDLEKNARKLAHQRREGVREHVHKGTLILIWMGIAILALMLLTWVWHLLTPEDFHYLTERQYNDLKNALFSAALARIVSDYAKKML